MKNLLLPALCLSVLAVSACENLWNRQGIGFTGINGEPKTFTETRGRDDYVARRLSVPAELAGIPTTRVQSDKAGVDDLAKAAIAAGGRTPDTAVQVGGESQTLMLSTVQVNSTLFAVLRTPSEISARMAPDAGAAFLSSVPRLTGCLAAGDVYQRGSTSRTTGVAVPLDCR